RGSGMAREIVGAVAEASHVIARQVDAALVEVDRQILPEVRQLQRRADVVGTRLPLGIAIAEQRQHQVPDRIGGMYAIVEEVVERREAGKPYVHAKRGEEAAKRLDRYGELTHGLGERNEDRMPRLIGVAGVELALPVVERGERARGGRFFVGEVGG